MVERSDYYSDRSRRRMEGTGRFPQRDYERSRDRKGNVRRSYDLEESRRDRDYEPERRFRAYPPYSEDRDEGNDLEESSNYYRARADDYGRDIEDDFEEYPSSRHARSQGYRGYRDYQGTQPGYSYGGGYGARRGEREHREGSRMRDFAGRGPKGYQRSDERIREEVCDCLSDHSDIDASDIEVQVENGQVTLTGTVDERRAKRMAEDAAEQVRGVKDVTNQLRVQARDESDSGRHAQQSRSTSEQKPQASTARNKSESLHS